MSQLQVDASRHTGAVVLELAGRLDQQTSAVLGETVNREAVTGNVIFDFTRLSYVSSLGLRAVLGKLKKIRGRGDQLGLIGLQGPVRELFELSGFLGLIPSYADRTSALAALGAAG